MSAVPTILLAYGTTHVIVEDIPRLIAGAHYPEPCGERAISRLRKTSGTFVGPVPLDNELTAEDWKYVLTVMPSYRDGMQESEYREFEAAFNATPDRPDWQLLPFYVDRADARAMLEAEVDSALRKATERHEV